MASYHFEGIVVRKCPGKLMLFWLGVLLLLPAAGVCQQQPAQPPQQQQPAAEGNPFPGEENNAPVLPANNAVVPVESDDLLATSRVVPALDTDPVRSPENSELMTSEPEGVDALESSSLAGVDGMNPDEDTTENPARKHGRGKKGQPDEPEHQETAKEDLSVGFFYLDQQDWKGALSRFQSAMVLDPENPDVFFVMAEAELHMGRLADARAHYQRVLEYDPDSKHGKQARKALKEMDAAR